MNHGSQSALTGRIAAHAGEADLRVAVLTADPDFGGPFPKMAPLLVRGMLDAGLEVRVLGWSAHTPDAEPLLVKTSGRLKDLVRVLSCVREWRPSVLYVATAHTWKSLLRDSFLTLAVGLRGPALVLHLHGSRSDALGRPGEALFTLWSKWLMRRAAVVMLLSTEEQRQWQSNCPDVRFEVVVNPFEAGATVAHRRVPGADRREWVLLAVARLMRTKGLFEVLEALEVLRRDRSCRLVIAGAGPAADELAEYARALGIDDAVDMVGYLTGPALASAYANADVFVLPSYHDEGFPLTVMEAMGSGLPIVTTRIRGCADHLVPEVNALFVPPRDAASVAAAVERLLGDDDLRLRMGEANAVKVADFSPEVVVPRYVGILRSVAIGPARHHG